MSTGGNGNGGGAPGIFRGNYGGGPAMGSGAPQLGGGAFTGVVDPTAANFSIGSHAIPEARLDYSQPQAAAPAPAPKQNSNGIPSWSKKAWEPYRNFYNSPNAFINMGMRAPSGPQAYKFQMAAKKHDPNWDKKSRRAGRLAASNYGAFYGPHTGGGYMG